MTFRAIFPQVSNATFRALLSKAAAFKLITRICKGIYLYRPAYTTPDGCLLFHVATLLRADKFNYISLETALSQYSIIPKNNDNWISIMSSGGSNKISCGDFGTIEFIHTKQKPSDIKAHLFYHKERGLWQADVILAIRDMKRIRKNLDLIDWHKVNEIMP